VTWKSSAKLDCGERIGYSRCASKYPWFQKTYVVWGRPGPRSSAWALSKLSSAYSSPENAAIAATSDRLYNCPSRRWARLAAAADLAKVYRGLQNHTHASGPSVALGPYHASDVPFLYRNFDNNLILGSPYTPTAAELELSATMIGYWARFAATGNPNGGGAPFWPEFEHDAEDHLLLDIPLVSGTNFHAAGCDFWDANT
jgi:para-nitrobenzyl esterase